MPKMPWQLVGMIGKFPKKLMRFDDELGSLIAKFGSLAHLMHVVVKRVCAFFAKPCFGRLD